MPNDPKTRVERRCLKCHHIFNSYDTLIRNNIGVQIKRITGARLCNACRESNKLVVTPYGRQPSGFECE